MKHCGRVKMVEQSKEAFVAVWFVIRDAYSERDRCILDAFESCWRYR